MTRPTLFRQLVLQRNWTHETFSIHFSRAAKELAVRLQTPSLASVTVSPRTFERWMAGEIKDRPRAKTCEILEHLLGHSAEELFAFASAQSRPHRVSPTSTARSESMPRGHGDVFSNVLGIRPSFNASPADRGGPYLAAVDAFRFADRQLGGGHVYPAVVSYLRNAVAPQLVDAQGFDTLAVFRSAASLSEMAGWMAHDAGYDNVARQHFAKGLQFAQAVPQMSLGANILSSMSHLALQSDNLDDAISLARAGHDRLKAGPAVPMLSARLHAMEARALSRLGEMKATDEALSAARGVLDHVPDEATPHWVAPFDEAALASETALSLQDLSLLPRAAQEAERAVTLRTQDRVRSRAFGQITLARILAQQGEPEAVCTVGEELLGVCQSLGSLRISHQLAELAAALDPYRNTRAVRDFLDRLTTVCQYRAHLLASLDQSMTEGAPK